MSEFIGVVTQSVSVLCDYIVKLQALEVEKLRILKDAELMGRKIAVTERIALERLANQKLVLQNSMEVTAQELNGLHVSREVLVRAVDKLVQNIISESATVDSREISLRAIEIIREEIQKLREDTSIQFERITIFVQQALENPLNNNFLDGGE